MKTKTKKFGVLLLGITMMLGALTQCKEKKEDNSLLLAAILYLNQGRAPGVYISGVLVDENNEPMANKTVTIKGRGETPTVVRTGTAANRGYYKNVLSASPFETRFADGDSNISTQCGSAVFALYGATQASILGDRQLICDTSTLASEAVTAGIAESLVASGEVVAQFTTNANGAFISQKFVIPNTGNTYTVEVDGAARNRRLRVARSGTSSLLTQSDIILGNNTTPTEQVASKYAFSIFNLVVEVEYPRPIRTLEGTLASNVSIGANEQVILQGTVIVPNGVTLSIGEGAKVYGSVSPGGALLVKQGGKLQAIGTASNPVVFSSEKAIGQRQAGDWQGIILQGNGIQTFGSIGGAAVGEGDVGTFGGNNNADSSGTLRYVRIEFAGAPFSPGNERNCLSLMGVGSGTSIDYVQCHKGFDDGFEWWGGAVDHKYIVSTANRDDQFDFTDGYIGRVQYAVAHLDINSISANDDTSRCVEGDGNTSNSCSNSARSGGNCADPWFANLTCVASNGNSVATSGTNLGPAWFIRRSGAAVLVGSISHSVILGTTASISCTTTAGQEAITRFGDITTSLGAAACAGGTALGANSVSDAITLTSVNVTAPDWTPTAGTITASGNLKTVGGAQMNQAHFDDTNYRGAINTGGTKWWDGWTSFPAN
ncbi:hypothetical protein EHQ68_15485 [Leptospira congkakensis]|uniref:Lipoprotein n=1 Tax=Leptospira congkakensis TaxID=2484932 RepID=A0A4Z1A709_9LEPT|nr:hypothetical protein [Leptospira congkakensis]TGL86699.1 hypothetical protein EHQ68_15485 [Leptospira congkakensis]TGL93756.1 hypothetical protein EHQ69_04545 [Leptospira congkakensis]TGL94838.1 hypothetical protein EHQ70_16250 [Leptospira congkakensis]